MTSIPAECRALTIALNSVTCRPIPPVAYPTCGETSGHSADVGLVDDRAVPRRSSRPVIAPGEGLVDDHAFGHPAGAVPGVDHQILFRIADWVAVQGVTPSDGPADGLAVGIDEQLVGIEPVALLRCVRPVDAVAVQLARPNVWQVAVPDQVSAVRELDPFGFLFGLRVVEQAQLDRLAVLGEDGEVDPLTVPRGSQRMGIPRPDAHLHRP